MKRKLPLIPAGLPEEIAMLEELKQQVNIAQLSEVVNCFAFQLANKHSTKSILKYLAHFRNKPFGFWSKKHPPEYYKHHGKK